MLDDKIAGYAFAFAAVLCIVAGALFCSSVCHLMFTATVVETVEVTHAVEKTVTYTVTVQPAAVIMSAYAHGPKLTIVVKNTGDVRIDNVTASVVGSDAALSPVASAVVEPGQNVVLDFFLEEGYFEPGRTYTVMVTVYGGGRCETLVCCAEAF